MAQHDITWMATKLGITPAEFEAGMEADGADTNGLLSYSSGMVANGRRTEAAAQAWMDAQLAERALAVDAAAKTAAAAPAARRPEPMATERQAGYILSLLARRSRDGDGGGFYSGPTDRAGILAMTRSDASAYINSLTDQY